MRHQGDSQLKLRSHFAEYFPIYYDRDKFSNREQYETHRNGENAILVCDHLSEYLRMCFRLYEDSSRTFHRHFEKKAIYLSIQNTKCEKNQRNTQMVQNITWMIPISLKFSTETITVPIGFRLS